ncbi:MAG: GNAT family N-acetyltransferase [Candidatus Heimdallarchaeota archaeon]|nr:GNAT family N-acetyltransferase [Candidatus Heimdallarchaeota archaeon]MCK5048318.1 GNAT family N-acetyltransferase [Candidatus Heimdallarchaeota archaeon]
MYEGNLVRLRSLEETDLDDIMDHINNYKMLRYMGHNLPYSRGDEEEWIRTTWDLRKTGKGYFFAFEEKQKKKFLGIIGLGNVSHINRSAEFVIAIHNPDDWNKGYGTDGLKVILSFSFDLLNLHSIMLQVHAFNKRGIRSYQKTGFKEVGRLREKHYLEGTYHDVVIMDIVEEEYHQLARSNDWPSIY